MNIDDRIEAIKRAMEVRKQIDKEVYQLGKDQAMSRDGLSDEEYRSRKARIQQVELMMAELSELWAKATGGSNDRV